MELRVTKLGLQTLGAIEALSINDILALRGAYEEQNFLDLNATLYHQFKIDNAINIVSKLKSLGFIEEV